MSEYKPTYDTPCHNFPGNLEDVREKLGDAADSMMGVAMDYINDLEHALSKADDYSLELRDEISKMNDNVYRELCGEFVDQAQYFANFACDDWETHGCYNCALKRIITRAKGVLS